MITFISKKDILDCGSEIREAYENQTNRNAFVDSLLVKLNSLDERIATPDEALQGTDNSKRMTPLRVKQLIGAGNVNSVNGKTGTVVLVTSDIEEVGNLYYTDARANAAADARITLQKGQNDGLAELDGGGKVPLAQLPDTILGSVQYKGTWNATTNSPNIAGSSPDSGDYYVVSVAGSTSLGGITDWQIGDWAIYNGTTWEKVDNSDQVSSVNGQTGTVVLDTSHISENGNLYYTTARFNSAFALKSTSDLSEGSNQYFTNERVDDRVAALIQNGTGISWTYDDTLNTLVGNVSITQYDNEMAQDTIGGILVNSTSIQLVYDDDTPSIIASVIPAGISHNLLGGLQGGGATERYHLTAAQHTVVGNTSGTNTGDQSSIAGITGTKAQFNSALSDGDFLYLGDVTQYTNEMAMDAIAASLTDTVEIGFTYDDGLDTIEAYLKTGSIVAAKLDALINASLALADTSLQASDIGVSIQAYSSILDNTTASFLTAQETKLGFISVTQAVDLDQMELDIAALDTAVTLRGTWDASSGTFPGGGTAQAGYSYIVSVGGTVDGEVFTANDRIVAITDNASTTTYAANWHKLDYTDQVLSVFGRTGAVTAQTNDYTWAQINKATSSLVDITTRSHADLQNNAWTSSGHTGTASRLAAFNGAGAASEIDYSTDWLTQYILSAGRSGGQTLIGGISGAHGALSISTDGVSNAAVFKVGGTTSATNAIDLGLNLEFSDGQNKTITLWSPIVDATADFTLLRGLNNFTRFGGSGSPTLAIYNANIAGATFFDACDINITTMRNFYAQANFNVSSASPTVGTQYGFYIDDLTFATTNWGFYNAGTAHNYLGTGNTGIGVISWGSSATKTLGIGNGTPPTTSPADMIQIYSTDLSAGNATLGLRTETAVTSASAGASDAYLNIKINGTTYKLLLHT